MFAVGAILLEIVFVLLKPQELWPWLQGFKPLYTLPALIVVGLALELGGRGHDRIAPAPFLRLALTLFGWAMLTVLVYAPGNITAEAIQFGTSLLLGLSIAHGVRTRERFQLVAGVLLSMALVFAFVGAHQARAPMGCLVVDTDNQRTPDGRECEGRQECAEGGDPGADYVCEHVGLMGTSSVTGRVRFRGNLEDPNELALTISVALPFAFAFFQRRRSATRLLLLVTTLALVGVCVVYTQSRGGQLVFLVVLGTYFLRRFGVARGLALGALLAVPVLMVGGRSSEEADSSSLERIECLQVGIDLVKSSPLIGIGKGQFLQHHFRTAHNSYVLSPAELGLPGFALWSTIVYIAVKTPLAAMKALEGRADPESDAIRTWATAVLASTSGMIVGIFFLSFSYHPVLWIYLGMSGALAAVARRELPDFQVRVSAREVATIVGVNLVLLAVIFAYTKQKLG